MMTPEPMTVTDAIAELEGGMMGLQELTAWHVVREAALKSVHWKKEAEFAADLICRLRQNLDEIRDHQLES